MNSMIGNAGMRGPTGQGKGNKIPSGYKEGRIQNYTPEQMQLFRQMFSNVSPDSYLSKLSGGDQSLFDEMEAPALRQFSGIQGNLASRFSGMGMGSRKSSGFQNSINAAGSDFSQDLQSRRQSLQQNAIKELMGLSGDLLGQRPYDQFLVDKPYRPSTGDQLIGAGGAFLGGIGQGIGTGIGKWFGG